jgi:class 3 adenylate cyclase
MVELGSEIYRAFLMTDIVGSTMMTQQDPSGYGQALAAHNQLAEKVFLECGGKLLKSRGQGDGLLGEFYSSADAVRAALAFQTALSDIQNAAIKCRFAVHFGVCYGDGEDYFGHTLNICARLRDIGHPNQILVSSTVAELATQLKSEQIEFYDLGWHGLKDIGAATQIFQVDRAGHHQPFLRLKTDARFKLPSFGTPFVGRQAELERVSNILGANQAVLLLGPGGIGKTRLAVRSAEIVASELKCPCVFANLIEAVDARCLPRHLGRKLSVNCTKRLIGN